MPDFEGICVIRNGAMYLAPAKLVIKRTVVRAYPTKTMPHQVGVSYFDAPLNSSETCQRKKSHVSKTDIPFFVQLLGWARREKQWAASRREQFIKASFDLAEQQKYCSEKPWLTQSVQDQLGSFIKALTPQELKDRTIFDTLKENKVNLHGVICAMAYHFWTDNEGEPRRRAITALRTRSKDWRTVRRRLLLSASDLRKIDAMYSGLGSSDLSAELFDRLLKIGRPEIGTTAEHLRIIHDQITYAGLDNDKKRKEIIKFYGHRASGPFPLTKELETIIALTEYFKATTNRPQYRWTTALLELAGKSGLSESDLIHRIEKFRERTPLDFHVISKGWKDIPSYLELNQAHR